MGIQFTSTWIRTPNPNHPTHRFWVRSEGPTTTDVSMPVTNRRRNPPGENNKQGPPNGSRLVRGRGETTLITGHITVGHRKQRKKARSVKFGSFHSCCHATTYTGDPSSSKTRQLKLPPLLDSPSGILHPPCLQTSLGKKKNIKNQKRTPPATPKDSVPLHCEYSVDRASVSPVRPNLFLGSHDSVIPRKQALHASRSMLSGLLRYPSPSLASRGTAHLAASHQALSVMACTCMLV